MDSAIALGEFCEQYSNSPYGKVADGETSSVIHQAIAFVLPPLPLETSRQSEIYRLIDF